MSNINKKNHEGYNDPTTYAAMKKIEAENKRFHDLLDVLYMTCALSGFEILDRIVLKDKKTGKIWR